MAFTQDGRFDHQLACCTDISDPVEEGQRLRRLSSYDELTALLN